MFLYAAFYDNHVKVFFQETDKGAIEFCKLNAYCKPIRIKTESIYEEKNPYSNGNDPTSHTSTAGVECSSK